MASPVIEGTATSSGEASSLTINFPASLVSGERLVVGVGLEGGGPQLSSWSDSLTEQADFNNNNWGTSGLADKNAAGTEGSTGSVAAGSTHHYATVSARISGHNSSTDAPEIATVAGGFDDSEIDPSSVSYSPTTDALTLVFYLAGDENGTSVTSPPTNYATEDSIFEAGGGRFDQASAVLFSRAQTGITSEDPGAPTMSGSHRGGAVTYGLYDGSEGSGGGVAIPVVQHHRCMQEAA